MSTKTCRKCGLEKPITDFPEWKKGAHTCFACHNTRRTEQRRKLGIRQREHVREYMREYREKNKEKLLSIAIKRRQDAPLAALWRQLASKNLKGKHQVTITRSEFMSLPIPEICPVLGIPISYELGRDNIPSVDRLNPNGPYSIDNIAIISYRANMVKSIGSAIEHEMIASWMRHVEASNGKKIGGKPIKIGPSCVTFGRARERV